MRAAKAAVLACLGFYNPDSGNQDLSLADLVTEGFEEVDYTFVKRLHHRVHNLPVTIAQTEVPGTDI